jgi:transmembrane sensor
MTEERLQYLLDRFLDNTATEEELREYADWYNQAGAREPRLFEDADNEQAMEYSRSLYASIAGEINRAEHEKKQPAGKRRVLYIIWSAAAAVVVVAGILVFYNRQPASPVTAAAQTQTAQGTVQRTTVTVKNPAGKRRIVQLQDGSVVELFAGSELRYEEPFGSTNRTLYLSGKGFFKVAKDSTRPFTVYSHDIATTALGTSFTITAWPGKNNVAVSLHTGKVRVQHMAQHSSATINDVYLLPGQQVTCNVITGIATLQKDKPSYDAGIKASPGSRTGFATTFEQEPMTAVLNAIEKGYSVHLQYNKDELADMLFSGRIREKDSLGQVLKRIAALYNLTVKATGKKYIIQKNH